MSENEKHTTGGLVTSTENETGITGWGKRRLGRAWKLYKYSSLYIATSAMVEVGIAMILLGVSLNPAPLIVGLVTFAVYTNDRIADAETDSFSNPEKAAFIQEYSYILKPFADGAYGIAVMISVVGGPKALSLTLLPGVFWVFYASGWFSEIGKSLSRLKEILIVNTTIVALAWAITLTFIPLTFTEKTLTIKVQVVFIYFFLRMFRFVEMSNILDVDSDRMVGVDTIPTVFGIDGTRRVLNIINLLIIAILIFALHFGYLLSKFAPALFLGIGYSMVMITLIGRWQNTSTLLQLAESEIFLTYAVLLSLVIFV